MRIIFLFLMLGTLQLAAQTPEESCKMVNEIALSEQLAHQRIVAGAGNNIIGTAASNNFDVKYYRCEWEVNPAIRYISGKVTIYFTVTASTGNIQLDLMNPLVVARTT